MHFPWQKSRPDILTVIYRYGTLRGIAGYALMLNEQKEGAVSEPDADAFRDRFWEQAKRERLTPWEIAFARTTARTVSPQQLLDGIWRLESVGVLRWALGMSSSLPAFDEQASPDILRAGTSENPIALRSKPEIEHMREIAEVWHWRCRTQTLIDDGVKVPMPRGFQTLDEIVRDTAARAQEAGDVEAIDGDFGAFGKAFRRLTADERSIVTSIAMERHFALNWLLGYAPGNRWDETPTHT